MLAQAGASNGGNVVSVETWFSSDAREVVVCRPWTRYCNLAKGVCDLDHAYLGFNAQPSLSLALLFDKEMRCMTKTHFRTCNLDPQHVFALVSWIPFDEC